jgi:putative transposase
MTTAQNARRSVPYARYAPAAMRHTTFRFALDPTPVQEQALSRNAGASRFAYNQSLRLVLDALAANRVAPSVSVPWSGFDLISAFNAWKRSEEAGRVFVVARDGTITKHVTGLPWRQQVAAQVFEEAAVDLGRALAAYTQAKNGKRKGRQPGFPRFKRKGRCRDSFRLRNRQSRGSGLRIRVGEGHPRSVTLPTVGTIRVHDDTRRLRRLLRPVSQIDPDSGQPTVAPRARVLFATVSRHGVRWYVSLNVRAPDLHPDRCHPRRPTSGHPGFVGIDRGLSAFVVAATSDLAEVGRWQASKPLTHRLARLQHRAKAWSRTKPGSRNRVQTGRRLSKEHTRIADLRRSFLHQVSGQLVKTHARLAVEDLAVAHLARNKRLARAIGDAAWAEFGRQLRYKASWLGAELVTCDRWFASTKTCSQCQTQSEPIGLAERTFRCGWCGLATDRDRNAAANLAAWAERHHGRPPDRQAGGRVINAHGGEGAGRHLGDGAASPNEVGTEARAT